VWAFTHDFHPAAIQEAKSINTDRSAQINTIYISSAEFSIGAERGNIHLVFDKAFSVVW
jgi:hypothetical protein